MLQGALEQVAPHKLNIWFQLTPKGAVPSHFPNLDENYLRKAPEGVGKSKGH